MRSKRRLFIGRNYTRTRARGERAKGRGGSLSFVFLSLEASKFRLINEPVPAIKASIYYPQVYRRIKFNNQQNTVDSSPVQQMLV